MRIKTFSLSTNPLLSVTIWLLVISCASILIAGDNASIEDLCGVSWVGTDYNVSFGEGLMVVKWIYYSNGTWE